MTRHSLSLTLPLALLALLLFTGLASAQTPDHGIAEDTRSTSTTVNASNLDLPNGYLTATEEVRVGSWDGTVEQSIRYVNLGANQQAEFVQLLTMPEDSGRVTEVKICFTLTQSTPNFRYDIVFYRNSGGQPGSVMAVAKNIGPGQTISSDICFNSPASLVTELPLNVSQKRFFVGVRFPEVTDVRLGMDENGSSTSPGFGRVFPGGDFEPMGPGTRFATYRNLAIDVEFEGDSTPPSPATCAKKTCVPGPNTLCLTGNRFEVKATSYNQQNQPSAVEFPPSLTPDTGYGHYGDPNNLELFVKVLNTCSFNPHYWVFIGGLTDLRVEMQICDTKAGVLKEYSNPPGTPFTTKADTSAFKTCNVI